MPYLQSIIAMDLRYARPRKDLVLLLRQKGIKDMAVLEAMGRIERHLFIPDSALHNHAYEDKAFPIGDEQTISQPYTVAFQTEKLEIKPNDKVLEIGTGSGYQAAVLAEMGARVYTIERFRSLYDRTSAFLQSMKYSKIRTYYGDGFLGKPAFAPFDKCIVTAAAPHVPETLIDQLRVGGMLVIPVENGKGSQDMLRITKLDQGVKEEVFDTFAFVPMLKGRI